MTAARQLKRIPAQLARTLLAALLLAAAANAAAAPDRAQALQALSHAQAPQRRLAAERLGEIGVMSDTPALVQALRDADAATRTNAEQALWRIWGRSGDRRIDALFQTGVGQMTRGELPQAITTFSRIIRLKPEFAEGWNKRATLYYLAGEYEKSLADCAEVIKRNPNHFGALAGYGQIYLRQQDYERALDFFRRALAVNPNMDGVKLDVLLLEQLLEQRRKDSV